MIKDKAKKYFKEMYNSPPNEKDLAIFAQQIIEDFIEKLENNKKTVKWNYGLDEVIFLNKLKELKELYGIADN
jgi:hypothetical protein